MPQLARPPPLTLCPPSTPSPTILPACRALSTIATVGFGDIVPQTVVETLVVLMVECIGVLFFGLLISSVR